MADRVKEHYTNISEDYYKKNNKHCEEVYIGLVRKYGKGRDSVLELGCGDGHMAQYVKGMYTGIDLSEDMMKQNKYLKDGDTVVAGDAQQLKFNNDEFDFVFTINLLEHVNQPLDVVREIQRVLKPGGIAFMITPNGDIESILDVLEKLHMKLPEGDHRFLKSREFSRIVRQTQLKKRYQKKILPFPIKVIGRLADSVNDSLRINFGMFQIVVCEKS